MKPSKPCGAVYMEYDDNDILESWLTEPEKCKGIYHMAQSDCTTIMGYVTPPRETRLHVPWNCAIDKAIVRRSKLFPTGNIRT
jgi:hypothetical protein